MKAVDEASARDGVSARERLIKIICQRSYREGDFTLSSGLKSSYYVDLKPTLLHPEGAKAFGEMTVEWLLHEKIKIAAVGGLTLGADPMVMAVSMMALEKSLVLPALMIRKEPKKHGTSRYIEGIENITAGASVLVLEDVVTTGASALKAIDILIDGGFKVPYVLSVVDRSAGGKEEFQKRGIPFKKLFEISELQEFYRNLKN